MSSNFISSDTQQITLAVSPFTVQCYTLNNGCSWYKKYLKRYFALKYIVPQIIFCYTRNPKPRSVNLHHNTIGNYAWIMPQSPNGLC